MFLPILPFILGSAATTAVGAAATAVGAAAATKGLIDIASAVAADDAINTDDDANTTSRTKNAPEKVSQNGTNPLTIYTLEEKVDILQSNIANIRKLSGLQTIQFAKYLQITKQALNNWETKKNKINFAQYILLTNFFQYLPDFPSIKCDKNTFKVIVSIIVFPELYSREELKKYQETITALADLSRNNTQVSTIFKALIKELPDSIPKELIR